MRRRNTAGTFAATELFEIKAEVPATVADPVLSADGAVDRTDKIIDVNDEPNHDELCRREQEIFLRAIREDRDLGAHWQSAVDFLRIVPAADRSLREGRTVTVCAPP